MNVSIGKNIFIRTKLEISVSVFKTYEMNWIEKPWFLMALIEVLKWMDRISGPSTFSLFGPPTLTLRPSALNSIKRYTSEHLEIKTKAYRVPYYYWDDNRCRQIEPDGEYGCYVMINQTYYDESGNCSDFVGKKSTTCYLKDWYGFFGPMSELLKPAPYTVRLYFC